MHLFDSVLKQSRLLFSSLVFCVLVIAAIAARAEQQTAAQPLFQAVVNGDYNQSKSLIQRGHQPTVPMIQSALANNYAGIAYLLILNTPDLPPYVLGDALLQAVANNQVNNVNSLVRLGADVNYRNSNDQTAISVALAESNFGMLGVLKNLGAALDEQTLGLALFRAVERDDQQAAHQLLRLNASPEYGLNGRNTLQLAAAKQNIAVLSLLKQRGYSISGLSFGRAFFEAIDQNNSADLNKLIALGADPNVRMDGRTPVDYALSQEKLGMARALIQAGGTEPSGRYYQRFFDDALSGNGQWVAALMKLPNYLSYRSSGGETVLHAAASTGQVNVIKMLLSQNFNPNVKTRKEWTPLHHAARFGHKLAVIHLLKGGADVYAVNSDGNDARRLAVIARQSRTQTIDTQGVLDYLNLWMQHHPRSPDQ